MELHEIERHARALMTAHGVGSLAFEFDGGKRRIGATHYVRIGRTTLPKKITFSRHFAPLLSEAEIRDTILHEIAHALAGRDAGHGPVWQAAVRKIGGKAERCKATKASPEKSVIGTCPICHKVVAQQHRLPLRVYFHRTCGKASVLTWARNGSIVTLNNMPERYRAEFNRQYRSLSNA